MGAGETWQLRLGQTLQYREWDEEYVLYNDLSGDTHLLGEAAIEVLLALNHGPASRLALAAMLDTRFEFDDTDADTQAAALLEQLRHLNLVEPAAC